MRRPATDARLMIAPLPCCSMIGNTYLQPRNAVFRLCWIWASQTSSLMLTALPGAEPPTLLTRTSMRPNRARQSATAASTSLALVMSTPRVLQTPPSFSMMALVTSAASLRRSTPKILAPWRASSTAVALPLPQTLASGSSPTEPAPEIKTTLSLRLSMLFSQCVTLPGVNLAAIPAQARASCEPGSDDAVLTQRRNFARIHAEPGPQHLLDVLAELRRRFELCWGAVKTHRPGGHLDLAGRGMIDRLHDAALRKGGIVQQLKRIEH